MTRLPSISSREIICFLYGLGFTQLRQKGSHRFFRHPDGRSVTVPDHKKDDMGRGIVYKILKDIDSSDDEFMAWLKK